MFHLTDIEGTTSSISFVKDVLFPFAAERMADWVAAHRDEDRVVAVLEDVRQALGAPDADEAACVAALRQWIAEDRKITPLKTLQGWIWKDGFAEGAFQAHIYDDALATLRRWHAAGQPIAVYSSGSIGAQKLYFAHTTAGDLTELFVGHFDTTSGSKKESPSYHRIAEALGLETEQITFYSDVLAELDAATAAGVQTVWVVREGALPSHPVHRVVADMAGL